MSCTHKKLGKGMNEAHRLVTKNYVFQTTTVKTSSLIPHVRAHDVTSWGLNQSRIVHLWAHVRASRPQWRLAFPVGGAEPSSRELPKSARVVGKT
jgi:hypothetical protein